MALTAWPLAAALVLALVAGCGSSTDTLGADALRVGKVLTQKNTDSTARAPLPTRASLDAAPAPLVAMLVESAQSRALLGKIAENRGVATFSTADAVTISLRDGVLVQTRSLGADLMSSAVPSAAQLARAGGSHTRVHDYLGLDDRIVRQPFNCTMAEAGTEVLTIAELTFPARILAETCTGAAGEGFENRWWIDRRGRIMQSRQWVGPGVGFVRLQDLAR
jgi:hypothetical protein